MAQSKKQIKVKVRLVPEGAVTFFSDDGFEDLRIHPEFEVVVSVDSELTGPSFNAAVLSAVEARINERLELLFTKTI